MSGAVVRLDSVPGVVACFGGFPRDVVRPSGLPGVVICPTDFSRAVGVCLLKGLVSPDGLPKAIDVLRPRDRLLVGLTSSLP